MANVLPFPPVGSPIQTEDTATKRSTVTAEWYRWFQAVYERIGGPSSTLAASDATYITQTPNVELANEQALDSLSTGLLRNTAGTGVLTIATQGTHYYAPGGTDVAVADGGTSASTAANARTNLGVAIGSDVQGFSSQLSTLASYNTNGIFTQTSLGTYTGRTITGTSNRITVSNGDGVSGNPTLDVGSNVYTTGGTDVAVADGGTGASTAAAARTNLGFADGIYTVTFTNVANLDAGPGVSSATYFRIGDTVHVSGKVTINPTITATSTKIGVTIPVASNFSSSGQLAGTAACPTIVGMSAAVLADTTNDRAQIEFISSDVNSNDLYFTFTYQVI